MSYKYVDFSSGGASVDDTGFGLRFAATPQAELHADLDYVDFGNGGDDTGLLYNINDSWIDDASSYGIGGRFYFSR